MRLLIDQPTTRRGAIGDFGSRTRDGAANVVGFHAQLVSLALGAFELFSLSSESALDLSALGVALSLVARVMARSSHDASGRGFDEP